MHTERQPETSGESKAQSSFSLRRLVGRVATVASGSATGQLVTVVVSPFLTRLYAPEAFGLLATYIGIVGILLVVSSLRYNLAIVVPASHTEAGALLRVSTLLVLTTAGITAVVVALVPAAWYPGAALRELAPYAFFVPLALLGGGLQEACSMWAVSHQAYRRLALARATDGTVRGISQLALAFVGALGPAGLLMGDVLGRWLGAVVIARTPAPSSDSRTRIGMYEAARRHRRFAAFGVPAALLNAAGVHAPVIVFAWFFGMDVAGWFALGQRVIAIPMSLVGHAVAQVFTGEVATLAREAPRDLRKAFLKVSASLMAVGLAPTAALALTGPTFFRLVFGEEWAEAGVYVRIAAVTYLLQVVVSPLSHILNVLGRQALQLAWDSGRLIVVTTAIAGAAYAEASAASAVGAFALSLGSAYVVHWWLMWSAVRRVGQSVLPDDGTRRVI